MKAILTLWHQNGSERTIIGLAWVLLVLGLGIASLFDLQRGPYWGVELQTRDDTVVASGIEVGGIAENQGLAVGSPILQIDGASPARYVDQPLWDVTSITWQDTTGATHVIQAPNPSMGFCLVLFVVALVFSSLGALVFRWSPDPWIRSTFFVFGQAVAVALITAPAADMGYNWASQVSGISSVLAGSAFTLFAAAFPHPLRGVGVIRVAVSAMTLLLCMAMSAFYLADLDFPPLLSAALWLWLIGQLAASVVILGTRAVDPATRKRLTPIMTGGAIGIGPVVLLSAIPDLINGSFLVRPEFAAAGAVALPLGMTYAILRHHLFGLDAMVRRFLLRSSEVATCAVLVTLAWSGVRLLGSGMLAIVVAALVLGLALPFLVPRVRLAVDAILYPSIARARVALDTIRPAGLSSQGGRLARAARDVVPVRWAVLVMRGARTIDTLDAGERRHGRIVAGDGDVPALPPGTICWTDSSPRLPARFADQYGVVPLTNESLTFGALVVGPRLDGASWSGIDFEALRLLVARAVMPVEAALLREQAEDEERYRQGLAGFARVLAGAGSPRDILECTAQHARVLLDADAGGIWVPNASGEWTRLAGLGDASLLPVAPPIVANPSEGAEVGSSALNRDDEALEVSFPIIASERASAIGFLARTPSTGPFGARDLGRLAEIVEYAIGALGRAEAVSAAAEAETLREINRVRTEIFDMVSHDLQSPLTVVRGYAELLQMHAQSAGEESFAGEAAEAILNAYRSCQHLIDDLLTSARLEKGRLSLTLEELDVAEVLDQLVSGYQVVPGGNRLAVDTSAGLIVRADRTRLEQMVGNLISNALRYAPRGPIVARAFGTPTEVTIEVRDDGPGIAPEDLPKIWEKFYRAGTSRAAPRGTGVGLSVVRDLAELHGGRAEVESVVGQGTTFRLVFPAVRPRASRVEEEPLEEDEDEREGPGSLLTDSARATVSLGPGRT